MLVELYSIVEAREYLINWWLRFKDVIGKNLPTFHVNHKDIDLVLELVKFLESSIAPSSSFTLFSVGITTSVNIVHESVGLIRPLSHSFILKIFSESLLFFLGSCHVNPLDKAALSTDHQLELIQILSTLDLDLGHTCDTKTEHGASSLFTTLVNLS